MPLELYDPASLCVIVMLRRQDDKLPSIVWIVDLARAAVLRRAAACWALNHVVIVLFAHVVTW